MVPGSTELRTPGGGSGMGPMHDKQKDNPLTLASAVEREGISVLAADG
jgi:hypothetical protein